MSAQEDQNDVEIEIVPEQDVPDLLPVIPLKNFVLYPQMIAPLLAPLPESPPAAVTLSSRLPPVVAS